MERRNDLERDVFWEKKAKYLGVDLWVKAEIRQLQDLPEGPNPRSLTSYSVPHVSLALATCIAPAQPKGRK